MLAKQIVNEEKDNAKKRQMVYEDVDESSSSVPTTQKKIRWINFDDTDEKVKEEKEEILNEWKWFLDCLKNTQRLLQFE